ncbi:hypothetical protein MBLNU459_g8533t1 [Dothideomycetes sp. NU459]
MATMASAAAGPTHPFTCNTCQVAFRSSDLQRTHMQSDWHRYNLKRRVASLPPLTSEIFAEKVLANKASAAATAARASFERVCSACEKTYYSENAYQNHIGSQKHKAQEARMRSRHLQPDDASSVMSSTFSLGEPLETASTQDGTEDGNTDVAQIVHAVKQATVNDQEEEQSLSKTPTNGSQVGSTDGLVEVLLNQCLFCNLVSDDVPLNLTHMSKQHGMYIPEKDYLVDLEGLLSYLHEKIHDDHQCLYCGQLKHTATGIQTHMRDRGHCMIPYSTEDEMLDIGEFYDFRATYSDDESDDESVDGDHREGGVKLGAARATKITVENGEGGEDVEMGEDDEGWESDSSLSSVPTDEITSVPIDDHSHRYKTLDRHRHHSHNDPRPHRNTDGFHSHAHSTPHAVYHDDYELHLPTGRTAGHRSLAKYYRQNLRNYPSQAERAEIAERRAIEGRHDSDDEEQQVRNAKQRDRGRQLMSRANGGLGMIGVTDAKKREIRAVEKQQEKLARRAQNKYQAGNERQGNFQKHYRDPLLQ